MATGVSAKRRQARVRRHIRVRHNVSGTADKPRLAVFRSARHIYAQVIDDERGHTLAHASTSEPGVSGELSGKSKIEQAKIVGRTVAERAADVGVKAVVFDRGGFKYHGRVRSLADSAREAGLEF